MLIWTNFNSFAKTYLIKIACLKNFIILYRGCAYFFANTKEPGTFRSQFLYNFFINFFLL